MAKDSVGCVCVCVCKCVSLGSATCLLHCELDSPAVFLVNGGVKRVRANQAGKINLLRLLLLLLLLLLCWIHIERRKRRVAAAHPFIVYVLPWWKSEQSSAVC